MSPKAGFISAENNIGAYNASGGLFTGPELNRLSDIYFLVWEGMTTNKKELLNVKYFVRDHVVNPDSLMIAKEACENDIPFWPGKSFDMGTPQGRAILSTPNGVGVAWFLINNKEELGVKVPTKVTVFKTIGTDKDGKPEDWIHFIFYIAPYSGKKKGRK